MDRRRAVAVHRPPRLLRLQHRGLADGIYALGPIEWSPATPDSLRIAVRRYIPCADGVNSCSSSDGSYRPTEVGLSPDERILDGATKVYLAGQDLTDDTDGLADGVTRATDGAGFRTWVTTFVANHDEAITSRLAAGTPAMEIVADRQANPRNGFSSAADSTFGPLYYRDGGAPAIMVQGGPTALDALIPVAVEAVDGALTLFVYAGYLS